MTITVWAFVLLSTFSTPGNSQVVDNFPTLEACNKFRVNVQQYLDVGVAPNTVMSECFQRQIVR